jgi:hypothetical protein
MARRKKGEDLTIPIPTPASAHTHTSIMIPTPTPTTNPLKLQPKLKIKLIHGVFSPQRPPTYYYPLLMTNGSVHVSISFKDLFPTVAFVPLAENPLDPTRNHHCHHFV